MKNLSLFTDGGVVGKNPSDIGGTWAWVLVDDANEIVAHESGTIIADGHTVTNNQMELYAILQGLTDVYDRGKAKQLKRVYSDSKVSLGRLTKGWSLNNISAKMVRMLDEVKKNYVFSSIGGVTTVLLDGHPTKEQLVTGFGKRLHPVSKWNVLCDDLCNAEKKRFSK